MGWDRHVPLPLVGEGDLLVQGAAAPEALAAGAEGDVLSMASGRPAWAPPAAPDLPLASQGDLLVQGAAEPEALPVGAVGEVLTVQDESGTLGWQAPAEVEVPSSYVPLWQSPASSGFVYDPHGDPLFVDAADAGVA